MITVPSLVTLTIEPDGKGYTDLVPLTVTAMLPLSGGETMTLSPCVFVAVVIPSFVVIVVITVVAVPSFIATVAVLTIRVVFSYGEATGKGGDSVPLPSGTSIQA